MSASKIVHIAGWNSCGFYRKAANVLSSLSLLFPSRLTVVQHEFDDRSSYRKWLLEEGDPFRMKFSDTRAHGHASSPFVWFSKTASKEPDGSDIDSFLGGHDDTMEWCRDFVSPCDRNAPQACMVDDGHKPNHGYDYDLVVIGGGSGGMAAAKEAADLGANVACLDFVKPSPQGTTWGLGGTCVNVGCIPKKLFHFSALFHESVKKDNKAFGIRVGVANGEGEIPDAITQPSWDVVRDNVQDYIRSLNFKYRVRLREKNVKYLNKLAKFVNKNTIEVTDKKGKTSTITSSRFLIAVGGRPTPLECEGGELAVDSDDIFSLDRHPGKTLCVGASYISLECAGFLAGLGIDVTVAVRSILLRGFDRECVNKIGDYMESHGVKFRREVVPKKLEKVDGDRIKVTFSDDAEDVFDTVLVAIGRRGDTSKLGLENVGVEVNPKNKRIIAKEEQTTCPNVYVVGDAMDAVPELTPVAIQSGIILARRLFAGAKESMDYVNVCTTVFTPIEYSCVGLTEEQAIEKIGEDNIEVYHRSFLPLEWSISHGRADHMAFAKVIVDKTQNDKVIGMHFVGPNAGEVMQGYGTSMKQGITFKMLTETVGIHPTSSEEFVTLTVTKRSGEDASAGGC